MQNPTFQDHVPFSTGRISVTSPDRKISSVGTGFFYQAPFNDGSDNTLTFLISNKHVFIDPKFDLTVHLNRKNSKGDPIFGNLAEFRYSDYEKFYVSHPDPDVDLACINFSFVSHTDAFYKHLTPIFMKEIDYSKVKLGSDVMFVGYPENRYDEVHNLPLIRKGSIASLPYIDFNGKSQIIVDAQVFPGSSGSPVFTRINSDYFLLGVISQTMIKHSRLQTIPSNISNIGVQQMLGLGIIIKQIKVQELIDHAVKEIIKRNNFS